VIGKKVEDDLNKKARGWYRSGAAGKVVNVL
jgi:hypothetical protein